MLWLPFLAKDVRKFCAVLFTACMDRFALQRLSTEQLMHLILVIIHIVCSRLNIVIDPTAVFSFQFPSESYDQIDLSDIEAPFSGA